MSMIPRCGVCDDALNPYGQDTRCPRCSLPCPTCNGDTALCKHPLRGNLDLTTHEEDPFPNPMRKVA